MHVINTVTIDATTHAPVPDIVRDVSSETDHARVLVPLPVRLSLPLPVSVSSMLGVSSVIVVVVVPGVSAVIVVVAVKAELNRIATALSLLLVLVHGVLKWLHHAFAK